MTDGEAGEGGNKADDRPKERIFAAEAPAAFALVRARGKQNTLFFITLNLHLLRTWIY